MAENVGSISYDVDINTSKLLDGERKVAASMDKIGSKATAISSAVTAAFAAISLGSFITKLVEVQRQFDILNAGLITATGSVEAAGAAFEALQKFAATTPYSIDQAVTAFTRLKNLGLDPSIKSLTAYGNTASAMGKDLMQMVEAVADASTGEFERLKEFGIRASKQGDNVSLTFKGVTETVKFSSENIQKYLLKLAETNFSGAMEERAKTLDGALSNLGDSWDQLFLTISKSGIGENIADAARVGSSALDVLGRTINSVDDDSKTIRNNDHLKRWADSTVNAMANIADAAQKVWQTVSVLGRNVAFVFDSIGTEIGARAAQAKALLSGDFEAASDMGKRLAAESAQRRAALDKADAETLNSRKSWGDRMRDEWKKGVMPLDPNALGGGGKSGGVGGGSSSASKSKFDSQGYINDLVIANADGLAKIDAQEKDALDKAKKLLSEKKISQQQYEQAVTLIRLAASKDREEIRQKERDDLQSWLDEQLKMEEEAAKKRQEAFENARSTADPMAALRAEYEAKLKLFDEYQAQLLERGIVAETDQQAARTAITAEYEKQRQALAEQTFRNQSEANAFLMDSLDSLASTATNSITGLIDGTMTSKEAMIELGRSIRNQAIDALVQMGIQYVKNAIIAKTTTAATTAAQTAAIGTVTAANIAGTAASTTAAVSGAGAIAAAAAPAAALTSVASFGTAAVVGLGALAATMVAAKAFGGGRQYGGAVNADSFYRVGESGPEMFTASNGQNYMIPGQNGKVVPNGELGGKVSVVVNNYASGVDVSATQSQDGSVEITVQRAVAEVASQIASNNGQVWSALKGATSIQSKL